jgi:hypothetical protein
LDESALTHSGKRIACKMRMPRAVTRSRMEVKMEAAVSLFLHDRVSSWHQEVQRIPSARARVRATVLKKDGKCVTL